jgi:hypothetical protein
MLVLLVGAFVGLVFLLGGISGSATRIRSGLRSMRLRNRGTTVDAEVLTSVNRSEEKGVAITGHWTWGQESYKRQFIVSDRWWMVNGGLTIPVRLDPNRPRVAEIDEGGRGPMLSIALGVAFGVMAVVGAAFLFRAAGAACDTAGLDFLDTICERIEPYI